MKKLFALACLVSLAACGGSAADGLSNGADALVAGEAAVCPGPLAAGEARCHAHVLVDRNGKPVANASTPSGFGPSDLWSAYGLPSGTGSTWTWNGKTVAIVDAYDLPTAENDVNVYRSQYGLPPCTTANGCFKKVGQTGGAVPKSNAGWGQEIALDLDMVSAVCPSCKILLVEASSTSMANLGTAVNEAVSLGANVVSNSYGGSEYSGETGDETKYYNHPGVVITVSSGDSNYGVEFPAASQYVISVGGTALTRDSSTARGWTETVWHNSSGGPGSGCSAYVTKPSWQKDTGCANRTVADVAAVADPYTGVAVYDSTAYRGSSGWMVFGGTSAASPIVGAIEALTSTTKTAPTYAASSLYGTAQLWDVTSGNNGTCSPAYLCTAGVGYDGPTGNGTPNGVALF